MDGWRAFRMEDLEVFVLETIDDVSALAEDRMRLEFLGRRLKGLQAEDIANFFDVFYRIKGRPTAVAKINAALVDHERLKEIIGQEKYGGVLIAAMRRKMRKVSRLFSDLPPHKKGVAGYAAEEEIKMEHVSLGQRRSLSKRNIKDTIDRLLSDPDPMVITNILNNPRTTETEAVKIASKRPNSPAILKTLVMHRKWAKRYNVLKAVAMNPYAPPRLAMALLEAMLAQDLKQIMDSSTVHPQVRMSAGDIFRHKKGE